MHSELVFEMVDHTLATKLGFLIIIYFCCCDYTKKPVVYDIQHYYLITFAHAISEILHSNSGLKMKQIILFFGLPIPFILIYKPANVV